MDKQDSPQISAIKARYQKSFVEKSAELLALYSQLQIDDSEANRDLLHEYLHRLAGSSGMYGYGKLSDACRAAMSALQFRDQTVLANQIAIAQAALSVDSYF